MTPDFLGAETEPASKRDVGPAPSPLLKLRRISGYGVVIAVTPYLLVKIAWVIGLFLPTEQMGEARWRGVNAATVAFAAVAILLAPAFCRPWGERLPAWLVGVPVWVGTGLLVPIVFLAPVLGPAAMARDNEAGAAEIWAPFRSGRTCPGSLGHASNGGRVPSLLPALLAGDGPVTSDGHTELNVTEIYSDGTKGRQMDLVLDRARP